MLYMLFLLCRCPCVWCIVKPKTNFHLWTIKELNVIMKVHPLNLTLIGVWEDRTKTYKWSFFIHVNSQLIFQIIKFLSLRNFHETGLEKHSNDKNLLCSFMWQKISRALLILLICTSCWFCMNSYDLILMKMYDLQAKTSPWKSTP